VQLFAASLVACTAHYAGSYLARHGLSTDGLVVQGDFVMASDRPARVVSLSVRITPPVGLSESRKAGLLAVASQCTVHHSLQQPPTVSVVLSGSVEPVSDPEVPSGWSSELVGASASRSTSERDLSSEKRSEAGP
jgi:hypothetical protein